MSRIDLGLRLARPDDDTNERELTTALNELVHDELDAASAARLIDDIITKDCQQALAAYNSASEEQKKNDTVAGPAPQGWQQYLYDCLATAAMKVAVDHSGQERLVDLLEELGRLPRHTVPVLYFEPERIAEKELWVLTGENNYDGFGQWMWERYEGESRLPSDYVGCPREVLSTQNSRRHFPGLAPGRNGSRRSGSLSQLLRLPCPTPVERNGRASRIERLGLSFCYAKRCGSCISRASQIRAVRGCRCAVDPLRRRSAASDVRNEDHGISEMEEGALGQDQVEIRRCRWRC